MNKFLDWLGRNRKTIGYTIGGLNVGNGIGQMLVGQASGLVWVVIGVFLIWDAYEFK